MKNIKNIIANAVINSISEDLDVKYIEDSIEIPKFDDQGDYALPCFVLSKILKKSPVIIAEELSENISDDRFETKAINGFLNFYFKTDFLAELLIPEVLKKGDKYGKSNEGKNKKIIVEYSSANISKELHFGYIRGIMIGRSLYNISRELGYETIAINHLGDYGINFGKIITAYLKWGSKEDIEKRGVRALLDLYVKFNRESENDESLKKEAASWFYKLEEEKDKKAFELWSWFKEISLKEYNRVYNTLDCHFDSFAGESFYSDMLPSVVKELKDKDLIFYDGKTELVNLEDEGLTNAVITTSVGTSLYITRDIAAALYRKEHYDFDKCFYVVGSEQKLHFKQLKAIIKKMGYEWYKDIIHVDNGLIMLESGKISSRKGNSLFLEDVINEAISRTLEIIEEKNPNLNNKKEVATKIALGAIAYRELSTSRNKDYVFKWEDAISFDGETGPYIQYTNVRCKSLLRDNEVDIDSLDFGAYDDIYAKNLILNLSKYGEIIKSAFDKQDPSLLARYIMKICKSFNKYYHNISVNVSDSSIKNSNLSLVRATNIVLENAMHLINMQAVEEM